MLSVTILSPHRDDAVFSLYLALSQWVKLPVRVKVINFFTISSYAPGVPSPLSSTISYLREREDRRALSLIHPKIEIESFRLLDAPLRFGIDAKSICSAESISLLRDDEIAALTSRISPYFVSGLVLTPLALGDHVDHIAVQRAAIQVDKPHRLGFYEDLPYATWTSDSSLRERVLQIERKTSTPLRSSIARAPNVSIARKRRAVSRYQTQIGRSEAAAIANFAARYRSGERIWVPRYAEAWTALT